MGRIKGIIWEGVRGVLGLEDHIAVGTLRRTMAFNAMGMLIMLASSMIASLALFLDSEVSSKSDGFSGGDDILVGISMRFLVG